MDRHKEIERERYDGKAKATSASELARSGSGSVDITLRAPYLAFERAIRGRVSAGEVVVDLGAGTGVHSLIASAAAPRVAVDISLAALALAAARGQVSSVPVAAVMADAERLPLRSHSVDLVTAAGALYCLDFETVLSEVRRVLKPNGAWIIVDSYDHNPLYRLNRRIGRALGRRTNLAVANIPDANTLTRLTQSFEIVSVDYFGIFAFLAPVFRRLIGAARTAELIDRMDQAFPRFQRYAFKIVVRAERPVLVREPQVVWS